MATICFVFICANLQRFQELCKFSAKNNEKYYIRVPDLTLHSVFFKQKPVHVIDIFKQKPVTMIFMDKDYHHLIWMYYLCDGWQ